MTLPKILIIDDEIAASSVDIDTFLSRYRLVRLGDKVAREQPPLAEADFCTGQTGEGENDYEHVVKPAVAKGWDKSKAWTWALVLLDVSFGKGDRRDDKFGEKVQAWLKRDYPNLPVVMLTAKSKDELEEQQGDNYLSKIKPNEHQFKISLARYGKLSDEQWRRLLNLPRGIVAVSSQMRDVCLKAFKVANGDASVLLLGESGVGKGQIAKYIHSISPRSRERKQMWEENAAVLKAEDQAIINMRIFGREKGYPNKGDSAVIGVFEQADNSTLFLDEIGDISLQAQASILKVLDDRSIRREGGKKNIPVDFRLITATRKEPVKLVADGIFREDFYYRIKKAEITIPPLRERPDDILPMANVFIERFVAQGDKANISLSPKAEEFLLSYPFPGNVRELWSAVEAIILEKGSGETITPNDLTTLLTVESVTDSIRTPVPPNRAITTTTVQQTSNIESSALTLKKLHEQLAEIIIKPHDPSLEGVIPRLEQAFEDIKKKLAGAALIASKGARQEPNLTAAWRYLEGVDVRSNGDGALANRFFNDLLGRGRKNTPLSEEDINLLIQMCNSKTNPQ